MKILIIGCNGQLGSDLMSTMQEAGIDTCGVDFPEIDLVSPDSVARCLDMINPTVIINPAAFTAVDRCESERETAFSVNETGVANLAKAAQNRAIAVVHFSTDYVFDGTAKKPYRETDPANPLTVYGQSKLAGERQLAAQWEQHWIVRISWLYGAHGVNFVKTILKAAQAGSLSGKPLSVVSDQLGSPTWTVSVCQQVLALIQSKAPFGVYHATCNGYCSWFDFAQAIVTAAGINCAVEPCSTDAFPRPAPRPAYSVLENYQLQQLNLDRMPLWEEAFATFWETSGEQLLSALKKE